MAPGPFPRAAGKKTRQAMTTREEECGQDRKVVTEEIPAKVSADKAYQNAMNNSGRENARLEHDRALERAVTDLISDHTELFKRFSDNPSFRNWLSEMVFSETYVR